MNPDDPLQTSVEERGGGRVVILACSHTTTVSSVMNPNTPDAQVIRYAVIGAMTRQSCTHLEQYLADNPPE